MCVCFCVYCVCLCIKRSLLWCAWYWRCCVCVLGLNIYMNLYNDVSDKCICARHVSNFREKSKQFKFIKKCEINQCKSKCVFKKNHHCSFRTPVSALDRDRKRHAILIALRVRAYSQEFLFGYTQMGKLLCCVSGELISCRFREPIVVAIPLCGGTRFNQRHPFSGYFMSERTLLMLLLRFRHMSPSLCIRQASAHLISATSRTPHSSRAHQSRCASRACTVRWRSTQPAQVAPVLRTAPGPTSYLFGGAAMGGWAQSPVRRLRVPSPPTSAMPYWSIRGPPAHPFAQDQHDQLNNKKTRTQ